MFPITVNLTITHPAQLADLAKLLAGGAAHMAGPQTGEQVITSPAAIEAALADTIDPPAPVAEAPGKPSSAAKTAPSRPTAAAAPSPSAAPPAQAAAPAPKAEPPAAPSTESTAGAPSAQSQVSYDELARAVNAVITKPGMREKLVAIAAKHGAESFKKLKPETWAAALADVQALGA